MTRPTLARPKAIRTAGALRCAGTVGLREQHRAWPRRRRRTVRVEGGTTLLAWAALQPASQIRLRAWSFDERRIDATFFEAASRAVACASAWPSPATACASHGEADGLPGLIVDRYADTMVAVVFVHRRRALEGGDHRRAVPGDRRAHRLYERSDASVRDQEAWSSQSAGCAATARPRSRSREHDWRFDVDIAHGHKTGFYLDQRDNRRHFADTVRRLDLQARAQLLLLPAAFGGRARSRRRGT